MATEGVIEAASSEGEVLARGRVGLVDVVAVVASALVALALVLPTYTQRPFWFDELVSIEVADAGWEHFLRYIATVEANMALYHVALRAWLGVADGEAGVRALSVGFGLATLPLLYALARRLYDRRTAVIAVLLLSVNVSFVGYARDARSYALTLLLVTAATYALVSAVASSRRALWALYGLLAALAVWAHLFAALVVVAHLSWLVVERRRGRALAGLGLGAATMLLLLTPLVLMVLAGGQRPQLEWLPRPGLQKLPGLFLWFVESPATLVVYFAGAATALTVAVRAWQRASRWPRSELLLVLWLLVPPALAFLLSYATPVYVYRYFLASLPALVILVATGFARMRPAWLGLGLAGAAVVLSVGAVATCQPDCKIRHDDWRAAVGYLDAHSRPGDAIVAYPEDVRTPLDHYLGAARRPRLLYPQRWDIDEDEPARGSDVAAALDGADEVRRIWLVTWWLPADDARTALESRASLRFVREFPGNVQVALYAPRDG